MRIWRRRRHHEMAITEMALEQGALVAALLTERGELVERGEAPPLPDGLLARIEGGWVTIDRAAHTA